MKIKVCCIDASDKPGDEGYPLKQGKVYTVTEVCIGLNTKCEEIKAVGLKEYSNACFDINRFVVKRTGQKLSEFILSLN